MKVSVTVTCPNEDDGCDAEFEVEGEVTFYTQRHPYGSTFASEEMVDFDGPFPDRCPECGADLDVESVGDRLIERAADDRWDYGE